MTYSKGYNMGNQLKLISTNLNRCANKTVNFKLDKLTKRSTNLPASTKCGERARA